MSLPLQAIDRLFDRLAATYGAAWVRQWAGLESGAVKSLWAHELSGYAGNLKVIAWALENLPERCPNLIEFRNLCRQAPATDVPMLPEPKADPQRLKAELAKLAPLRAATAQLQPQDPKAWARRILDRRKEGNKINPTTYRMACDALRICGDLSENEYEHA